MFCQFLCLLVEVEHVKIFTPFTASFVKYLSSRKPISSTIIYILLSVTFIEKYLPSTCYVLSPGWCWGNSGEQERRSSCLH